MTVSRVLHGRKNKVNEETYSRVVAAMQELDYVPVRSAVQNRHVETKAIGLVPYHKMVSRYKLDSVTYDGICESASDEGYDLLVMLRNEAARRKANNAPMSSSLFCTGVPVRHQRDRASSSAQALWKDVDGRRMTWADILERYPQPG